MCLLDVGAVINLSLFWKHSFAKFQWVENPNSGVKISAKPVAELRPSYCPRHDS